MTEHRTYVAAKGVIIRDPVSKQRVPHESPGIYVARTPFWVRRELDGDVIDISEKPAAPKRGKGAEEA